MTAASAKGAALVALAMAFSAAALPAAAAAEAPAAEAAAAAPGAGAGDEGTALATGGVDPARLFVDANTAYEEGDYRRAAALYLRLVDAGHGSGELYYNLGNAYLRGGELGRAIAAYRQSLRRLPRDEDVRANLAFARRSAKDAIQPPEPTPVAATLLFWHYGLSPGELAAAAAVLNVLFWGLLALRLFRRDSEALRWAPILVLVPLVAVAASLVARGAFPATVAVIVPQEIDARTGPAESEVVRFRLHAGTEVRVEDRRDGWLRIALPDGQQGWIARDHAEEVAL